MNVRTAKEYGPFLQMQIHPAAEHDGSHLVVTGRHEHLSPTLLRTAVDGGLYSLCGKYRGVILGTEIPDVVNGSFGLKAASQQ